MRIGERGQVTIPKEIRDRFGLGPETEVEFHIANGSIVLKKAPKKLGLSAATPDPIRSKASSGLRAITRHKDV